MLVTILIKLNFNPGNFDGVAKQGKTYYRESREATS